MLKKERTQHLLNEGVGGVEKRGDKFNETRNVTNRSSS